jgi:hypothetical protein
VSAIGNAIDRFTGLMRRTEERAARLAATRPYHATLAGSALATTIQPIFALHDQKRKGTCTAQAETSGIEPIVKIRLSSLGPWTDARWREGTLLDTGAGTLSDTVIDSVILRGVEPYVEGEDERPIFEDARIPGLQQNLQADLRRIALNAVHRNISTNVIAQISVSIWRGYATTSGGGLKAPYFSLGQNEVITTDHVGGEEDGHCRRLFGYIAPDDTRFPALWRGCPLEQNSWPNWGGIELPCDVTLTDGTVLPRGYVLRQCAVIRPEAVLAAWEWDALEVRLAT